MSERGSVSLVMAAVIGMCAMLSLLATDVTLASAARGRAQTAADAAALAAAQELLLPTGDGAEAAAEEYAARAGARLVACRCPPAADEVRVVVELDVALPVVGRAARVRAAARAVVDLPEGSEGLQPWFAARLDCLFDAVPGLSIVSGYRTREEQERLHRERPHLAAPPGRSMHERGLAADLGYPTPRARADAHRAAPPCGLVFPIAHEPWHVEPMGSAHPP